MAGEGSGGQERTEHPTGRRRAKARSEGQVARSADLSTAAVILSGTLAMAMIGSITLVTFSRRVLHQSQDLLSGDRLGLGGMTSYLRTVGGGFLLAFLPYAVALVALVMAVNLIQARGVVSLTPIQPNLSHLNPVNGFKKLFSRESLFTGLKAVLKLVAIGGVTYVLISRTLPELVTLSNTAPVDIIAVLRGLMLRLALLLGLAYLIVAGIDYVYQHFRLERNLKMTRQEVIYDNKDTEGDPHVKSRIMTMARTLARQRMLQQVSTADVVVVNPTRIAVALKYDISASPAPMVVAMGQRKLAARIREIAGRAGIPVIENRTVARALLATAKVGAPIPPALYAAVAEILAFVYRRKAGTPAPSAALLPGGLS